MSAVKGVACGGPLAKASGDGDTIAVAIAKGVKVLVLVKVKTEVVGGLALEDRPPPGNIARD